MPPGWQPPAEWEVELTLDQEGVKVRRWREKQLEAAGFTEFTAYRIALAVDVDYHQAIEMLEHGATELQVTDLLLD